MRTRAVFAGSAGGRTKVVSLRLNSAASDCISPSLSPCASGNTASGLPPKRRSVKTSTVTKENVRICSNWQWCWLNDLDADLGGDAAQAGQRARRGVAPILRAVGLDAGQHFPGLNPAQQPLELGWPRHVTVAQRHGAVCRQVAVLEMDGRGERGKDGDIGIARPFAGRPGVGDVDQGPQVAQLGLAVLLLERLLLVGSLFLGGLHVSREEGGELGD